MVYSGNQYSSISVQIKATSCQACQLREAEWAFRNKIKAKNKC